jgi:uncharacterized membrane protein YhaH (DUF805 family)
MSLRFPISVKHNPLAGQRAGYHENLEFWWKVSEHVFKFVGWCLMTGLIAAAAVKSHNVVLTLVTAFLAFLLFVLCLKFTTARFDIELRGNVLPSMLSTVITAIASILFTLSVTLLGFYVMMHVAFTLVDVQSIRAP